MPTNDSSALSADHFVAVMVIIFMLANLLVDLLYAVLDPRIRYAK